MFKRAERKKAKLRLALCGPSGSGKTYSALLMAQGLGGKIAFVDTEHGSGELYAHLCSYDVAPLEAPYTPKRYIDLIKGAEKGGYDVLVIDSLTHAWAGDGGILDMKDAATKASRSQNSFNAWREITPEHNRLVEAILASPLHIITTMRTRTAWEIVEDEKGKKKPVKMGLAPVQRDGMEYEFTVVLDLSIEGHIATSSKDRTSLFDGHHFKPSEETGRELLAWLESGAMPEVKEEPEKKNAETLDYAVLEKKVLDAAALPHLKNIWTKYQEAIKVLPDSDRKELETIKDRMKELIPICKKEGAGCSKAIKGVSPDEVGCEITMKDCPHKGATEGEAANG